jgi:TolA-binding protein
MATNQEQETQEPKHNDAFSKMVHDVVGNLANGNFQKYRTQLIIVAVAVVVALTGVRYWLQAKEQGAQKDAEQLGVALDFVYQDKTDSAIISLESFLTVAHSDLATAKANLLLGNLLYQNRQFEPAQAAFQKAIAKANNSAVLQGAAEHGLASTYMQLKSYDQAAKSLESFIQKYGAMTGDLTARYQGDEPQDQLPTIADAMWKLALTYKELGQDQKAKAVCEKIIKVYGTSTQATNAKKLLPVL